MTYYPNAYPQHNAYNYLNLCNRPVGKSIVNINPRTEGDSQRNTVLILLSAAKIGITYIKYVKIKAHISAILTYLCVSL